MNGYLPNPLFLVFTYFLAIEKVYLSYGFCAFSDISFSGVF